MDYDTLIDIWDRHGVTNYFANKYLREIEDYFNWDSIHLDLDSYNEEMIWNQEDVENYGENPIVGIFISTVFSLTPSGKYYTPWTCSNVEPKEAAKDSIYWGALEEVLENHGLFCQSGEGDPCDIFFCKEITKGE